MHSQVLCAYGDEITELALLDRHVRVLLVAVADYPYSLHVLEAAVVTVPVDAPLGDATVYPDFVGVLFDGIGD